MPLLSVKELSKELSVSEELIHDLIKRNEIVPWGGRARLGEPRFSTQRITQIKEKLIQLKMLSNAQKKS
jgi:predicted DNA-binding protein YlxM (UPF0122 family)